MATSLRRGPRRGTWLIGLIAGLAAARAPAPPPLEITSFAPTGEDARGAQQFLIRFSAPMIAFGDPRATAPANVECAAPGSPKRDVITEQRLTAGKRKIVRLHEAHHHVTKGERRGDDRDAFKAKTFQRPE